jgi:hypothetical protein
MSTVGNLSLTFLSRQGIKYLQMSVTPDQPQTGRTQHKYDVLNLIVLFLVACVLGIYLIASTALISKDGVLYIEQAKLLSSDPAAVMKGNTPGYPILIFAAHKFVGLFGDNSSLFGWIYTAQGVTLLCRLLALVPLYLIGKRLVGGRNSFYAMLILILLPHPAKMSCELTREWPHVLFLATGFLLLLRGAARSTWWTFGAAGVATGLAHIIRPEGAQLVVFGVLWLLLRLARPGRNLTRVKAVLALVVLLIGFAIPVAPYAKARGRIMPHKVRGLIGSSCEIQSEAVPARGSRGHNEMYAKAGLLGGMAEAVREFIEKVNENLLYFFVPPLLIGAYIRSRDRRRATDAEKFFITAFLLFNVTAPILLHCCFGYMSRRHVLPVVLLAVFYVPSGLRAISDRLEREIFRSRTPANRNPLRWYTILLIIGFAVCLPKLLQPAGADKQGYRVAAEWLNKNTDTGDIIAAADPRISFYAERAGLIYEDDVPEGADYAVRIVRESGEQGYPGGAAQEVYSVSVGRREKSDKKVVIYRIM